MEALLPDGGGSNSAVFVFQFPSTLITSTTSMVTVQNVGDGANVGVYFNVGSAATLNGTTFAGNVLVQNLISSDGNPSLGCGRLLSSKAQVTLIQDNIPSAARVSGSQVAALTKASLLSRVARVGREARSSQNRAPYCF